MLKFIKSIFNKGNELEDRELLAKCTQKLNNDYTLKKHSS